MKGAVAEVTGGEMCSEGCGCWSHWRRGVL